MRLRPGELVRLRFQGDPETGELRLAGASFTVANAGLEVRRKGWLAAELTLPVRPGDYTYECVSGGEVVKTGVLRIRAGAERSRAGAQPAAMPEPSSTYSPRRDG